MLCFLIQINLECWGENDLSSPVDTGFGFEDPVLGSHNGVEAGFLE